MISRLCVESNSRTAQVSRCNLGNSYAVACVLAQQLASSCPYLLSLAHFQWLVSTDSKQQTVSHSTIEKQRRDRINSLIDELRELVPSAATLKGPDGADMKRPKHVVLSDTISLLKHLQDKVRCFMISQSCVNQIDDNSLTSGRLCSKHFHYSMLIALASALLLF